MQHGMRVVLVTADDGPVLVAVHSRLRVAEAVPVLQVRLAAVDPPARDR